jgi:CDP-diacylglycerol pyrophosphatase
MLLKGGTMTDHPFDTLTRRASLLTMGAGVAALAAPVAAQARKAGNKANKKCKKQVGQCRKSVIDTCEGNQECEDAQLPCCEFLGKCNFTGFANCLG